MSLVSVFRVLDNKLNKADIDASPEVCKSTFVRVWRGSLSITLYLVRHDILAFAKSWRGELQLAPCVAVSFKDERLVVRVCGTDGSSLAKIRCTWLCQAPYMCEGENWLNGYLDRYDLIHEPARPEIP